MCLNPVLRQPVCEKLYHKMGYERKKLPEKKKKKREKPRASTVSTDVFQLCDLSFVLRSFFLSLCLSRFNKASCRVWLSWETVECGWSWGWIGASGGGGGRVQVGGASTSDHFPHAIHHAVWRLGRLPPFLYPSFLSLLRSLPFQSHFSCSVSQPLRLSPSPSWFPPSTSFSASSYSTSCCPPSFCSLPPESWQPQLVMNLSRRLLSGTITSPGTLPLSLHLSLWAQAWDDCPRSTINSSVPRSLSPLPPPSGRLLCGTASRPDPLPSFDRTLTLARVAQLGWGCACVCVYMRLFVSVGPGLVGGCFSSD